MATLTRIPLLLMALAPLLLRAQPSDIWIKENFLLEVHVIDDFIQRFNGEVDQKVLEKWAQLFEKKDISRKDVLYSLFNLRSQQWKQDEVERFLNQLVDPQCPAFLDFESNNWYATAQCIVSYQGTKYQTSFTLKVRQDPESKGWEWVVASMLYPEIFHEYCEAPFTTTQKKRKLFLSPMSHGANFGALLRAFADPINFVDCLDYTPDNLLLNTLAWEVYHGDFKLLQIQSVDYHFFQVPDWIFVVKQVAREDFNTGWLISELYPANPYDVKNYKKECLNLK